MTPQPEQLPRGPTPPRQFKKTEHKSPPMTLHVLESQAVPFQTRSQTNEIHIPPISQATNHPSNECDDDN
jgi:hypothetical protein